MHDAPDSIPRPRRDANGRALNLFKDSPICKRGHGDEALAWVQENRQSTEGARWRCLACRNAVARACQERRGAAAPRVRRDVVPTEALPPAQGWTLKNPFDFTRVRLEQQWGPYARWTMAQHRTHTRMLYHLLGWGDAAIKEPVIARDVRGVIHRRSAS